ncbi:MAG: Spy/CpxP family protein refolding chaperone [Xanthobacteraceae bacterium]
MLQSSMRVAALVSLSLVIVIPDAFGRGGGGGGRGGGHSVSGGRSFSGGHSFSAGRSFSGGRSFSAGRNYSAPRSSYASRNYSAPRNSNSYSVMRSASARSHSAPRQIAAPRHNATPQHVATSKHGARPNVNAPRTAISHPVSQARVGVAYAQTARVPGHSFASVHRNLARAGIATGRSGFHLANAGSRALGARALHNRFVAGRFAANGIHGRNYAHAATFRGHYANRFWHRHFVPRLVVLGWAGPLFWPYAYDDFVSYTFYPSAYDTFWPYAYDDVYDGIFGRYAYGNAPVRVIAGKPAPNGVAMSSSPAVTGPVRTRTDICKADTATSLTEWPIEQIALAVEPTDAQRTALDELRAATAKAVDVLKTACPNDLPSTPTGRIAAMQKRLDVMLLAVRMVRPKLDAFYQTLSDEQKARFNAIDPDNAARSNERDLIEACSARASGISSLPVDRIEQAVRPNEVQRVALKELRDAISSSVNLLTSECPTYRALTPVGRVEAMEQRLHSMSRAVKTLQPALDRFYGTLTDEQKERFNRLAPAQS